MYVLRSWPPCQIQHPAEPQPLLYIHFSQRLTPNNQNCTLLETGFRANSNPQVEPSGMHAERISDPASLGSPISRNITLPGSCDTSTYILQHGYYFFQYNPRRENDLLRATSSEVSLLCVVFLNATLTAFTMVRSGVSVSVRDGHCSTSSWPCHIRETD